MKKKVVKKNSLWLIALLIIVVILGLIFLFKREIFYSPYSDGPASTDNLRSGGGACFSPEHPTTICAGNKYCTCKDKDGGGWTWNALKTGSDTYSCENSPPACDKATIQMQTATEAQACNLANRFVDEFPVIECAQGCLDQGISKTTSKDRECCTVTAKRTCVPKPTLIGDQEA